MRMIPFPTSSLSHDMPSLDWVIENMILNACEMLENCPAKLEHY